MRRHLVYEEIWVGTVRLKQSIIFYFLGNCRWSLCGHTAPVSSLRLDPTGVFCLSYDADGRDRSIRLWNLNKGDAILHFLMHILHKLR